MGGPFTNSGGNASDHAGVSSCKRNCIPTDISNSSAVDGTVSCTAATGTACTASSPSCTLTTCQAGFGGTGDNCAACSSSSSNPQYSPIAITGNDNACVSCPTSGFGSSGSSTPRSAVTNCYKNCTTATDCEVSNGYFSGTCYHLDTTGNNLNITGGCTLHCDTGYTISNGTIHATVDDNQCKYYVNCNDGYYNQYNSISSATVITGSNWSILSCNAKELKIQFDKNSLLATGTMENQTCTYNSPQVCTLNANGFSLAGNIFRGWAKNSTGSVVYNNEATLTSSDVLALVNHTNNSVTTLNLYAIWLKCPHENLMDGGVCKIKAGAKICGANGLRY
jgi:hypothetical protein